MTAAIKINNLHMSFGPTKIINNLSLTIEDGERHAIIGPNGAGKSTLFHLISGRYAPIAGSIRLYGEEIGGLPPYEIYRKGLSRSFQVTNIFPHMSVFENIRCAVLWDQGCKYSFWHQMNKLDRVNRRTDEILERIGLTERYMIPAEMLSYADQRALEIGLTIGGNGRVVMLDEPTAGMSRSETTRAVALVNTISEGKTLVMVEHDMGVVFDFADRISVLVYGEIIASDTPQNIRNNRSVQE
ncbi:MAG: ABC transporter ATP-binding protein, partial [Fimbriimonadaceae bacterium]|nr:ABC transporter ATP-binding protein [Alphaproteobacteria bacterium]